MTFNRRGNTFLAVVVIGIILCLAVICFADVPYVINNKSQQNKEYHTDENFNYLETRKAPKDNPTFTGTATFADVDAAGVTATTFETSSFTVTGGNFSAQGKTWQLIYSTSNVLTSSFTVTGLNGNVDKEYYIVMSGSSTQQELKRTINGDTTDGNYRMGCAYNLSDYMRFASEDSRVIGVMMGGGTGFAIQYWQGAVASAGMTYRYGNGRSMNASGSSLEWRNYVTCWEVSDANITSLSFHATGKFYIFDFAMYTRR